MQSQFVTSPVVYVFAAFCVLGCETKDNIDTTSDSAGRDAGTPLSGGTASTVEGMSEGGNTTFSSTVGGRSDSLASARGGSDADGVSGGESTGGEESSGGGESSSGGESSGGGEGDTAATASMAGSESGGILAIAGSEAGEDSRHIAGGMGTERAGHEDAGGEIEHDAGGREFNPTGGVTGDFEPDVAGIDVSDISAGLALFAAGHDMAGMGGAEHGTPTPGGASTGGIESHTSAAGIMAGHDVPDDTITVMPCALAVPCAPGDDCGPFSLDGPCERMIALPPIDLGDSTSFQQYAFGVDSTTYNALWNQWKDLGYLPVNLSGLHHGSSRSYSGIWQKETANIRGWASHRNFDDIKLILEYPFTYSGYRILDLDAMGHDGDESQFSVVYVRENVQLEARLVFHTPEQFSLLRARNAEYLSSEGLTSKRPISIGFRYTSSGDPGFFTVWEDNPERWQWAIVHMSRSTWTESFDEYADNGYRVTSFARDCYDESTGDCDSDRFAAIWLRDADQHDRWASYRDLTRQRLAERLLEFREQNYEVVDIDEYRSSSGEERFAAQWVRRSPKDSLDSNRPLTGTHAEQLQALVDNYGGNMGFFIEDLRTGNYVSYNPLEHFYMASTTKVLIATKIMAMVEAGDLALEDEYTFAVEESLEATDRPTLAEIGNVFTLEDHLEFMVNRSSTNATDKLFSLIGQEAMSRFLVDELGMHGVGEITSICELDKRIVAAAVPCVVELPCREFERMYRDRADVTAGANSCVAQVMSGWHNLNSGERHEHVRRYYETLANSITPAQMAHFYRRLIALDILGIEARDKLLDIMTGTGPGRYDDNLRSISPRPYQNLANKNGSKHRSLAWTALAWLDGDDESGGASSIIGDGEFTYSINMFTEQFPSGFAADRDAARNAMGDAIGLAVSFLETVD